MMDCAQLHALAPELALGILSGQERAAAISHLETCPACQAEIDKLAAVADGLVALAPEIEPPIGFERAVIDALDPAPPRVAPRRRSRRWVAAAAVAVAAAVGGGGWALGAATSGGPVASPPPSNAMLMASLTTPGSGATAGTPVGRVWAYWGASSWLFMAIDDPAATGVVSCQLVQKDGRVVPVGAFALQGGYGWWGVPLKVSRQDVTQARIVDAAGHVLATAAL